MADALSNDRLTLARRAAPARSRYLLFGLMAFVLKQRNTDDGWRAAIAVHRAR